MKWLWLWVLLLSGVVGADPRQHCDVLLVVAHLDDETMVTGLLARLVFDRHKTVGVVYGTRGNGGTNANGPESARALGLEREIEARQALATLGIDHVWFLNGEDTPSQDVLYWLEAWHHGQALEDLVRTVRLTHPLPERLDGLGPSYATTDVSPSKGVPYYKISADEWKHHQSQDDVAGVVAAAERSGDWTALQAPERLVLGRTLVGGEPSEDILAHTSPAKVPWTPPLPRPLKHGSVELGGPWCFYRTFWAEHGLHLDKLWPLEAEAAAGQPLFVPLVLRNDTDTTQTVTLVRQLPAGWEERPLARAQFELRPHDVTPLEVELRPPPRPEKTWEQLRFIVGSSVETLRVYRVKKADLPQEGPLPPNLQ